MFYDQFLHPLHVWGDVAIEELVTLTEAAQSGLSILCPSESVLGTFAMAGKEPAAPDTFGWKTVTLADTEAYLLLRHHQFLKRSIEDIAHPVFRIYEMVAGIEVSVVLYHGIAAAGLGVCTYSGRNSAPAGEGGVELAHKIKPDIIPHPMVEDVAEVLPIGQRIHRPWRQSRFSSRRIDYLSGSIQMLHHRHELHVAASYGLQKAVNVESAPLARLADGAHGIILHAMSVKKLDSAHDLREGRGSATVTAKTIVYIFRAVYRYACQKVVIPKEAAPVGGEQDAVGLYGIVYGLAVRVLPFVFECLAIEVQAHEQGLSAMPVEGNLIDFVRLYVLTDEMLQHAVAHAWFPAAIYLRFVEIVTILAFQVAQGSGRLEHNIECHRTCKSDGILKCHCIMVTGHIWK